MNSRKCKDCKQTKAITSFYKDKSVSNGVDKRCKECEAIRSIERRQEQRTRHLRDKYNMTLEEYDDLLQDQDGVCAICYHVNPNGAPLVVDHNHDDIEARGLLCSACNIGLGHFKDSVLYLQGAINYLEERGQQNDG